MIPKVVSSGAVRRLLTLKEAAELLGLSRFSLRRLIARGQLPAVRLTRRIHIDSRDLDRLIDQSKDPFGLNHGRR